MSVSGGLVEHPILHYSFGNLVELKATPLTESAIFKIRITVYFPTQFLLLLQFFLTTLFSSLCWMLDDKCNQ